MVGAAAMHASYDHTESLVEALAHMHPELEKVREVATDPVYLVGGAVRDLLLGQGRADVDLVVVGDAAGLATRLGAEVVSHERFGTAKVALDGHELDIVTARSERYPHPGALPVVEPAAELEPDLQRRDFTINAMAIPLQGEPTLVDPYGGQEDLAARRLRVLHAGSFVDDPTRALRAARYAARFGFELEDGTAGLLRAADLSTVSADRRDAELNRIAAESAAPRAFGLLGEWGLVGLRDDGVELATRVSALLSVEPWSGTVARGPALRAAALGPVGEELALAQAGPGKPSEAVALASRHDAVTLVLARALGAEWLDRCLREWRQVSLEVDGDDLLAAGIDPGPALGRGLREALRRKLDGEISGREQELEAALEAARDDDGVA
jgi:tRNA nucleotidyltransferase (CCA-adding enzyme)